MVEIEIDVLRSQCLNRRIGERQTLITHLTGAGTLKRAVCAFGAGKVSYKAPASGPQCRPSSRPALWLRPVGGCRP